MRTSRLALHQLEPWLYYELQLKPGGAAMAFARNAHHVRVLSADHRLISYYHRSLLAYKEQLYEEEKEEEEVEEEEEEKESDTASYATTAIQWDSISTSPRTASSVPSWLPPPFNDCHYGSVVPVPFFLDVRQIDVKFEATNTSRTKYNSCNLGALLAKTCWIVQLHRHSLRKLTLTDVAIKNNQDLWILGQTIRSLPQLHELDLSLIVPYKSRRHIVASHIFFTLPCTIRKVSISSEVLVNNLPPALGHRSMAADYFLREWLTESGNGSSSDGGSPLSQLVVLHLWSIDRDTPKGAVVSILRHTPRLEDLGLGPTVRGVDQDGRMLGELCPRLRRLVCSLEETPVAYEPSHCGRRYDDYGQMAYDMPSFKVMEGFPHSLERVDLLVYLYRVHETAFRPALNWHSVTLRRFVLVSGCRASSTAICLILAECRGLEWVEVTGSNVDLTDAIASPWACTRVRHLELTVWIPKLTSFTAVALFNVQQEPKEIPYYQRQPPIIVTDQEQKRLLMLEALYRQIGQLEQMEYLNLRADSALDRRFSPLRYGYRHRTFPGMLNFGDKETSRPGFLDLLGGLKWLRVLKGSMNAEILENRVTMGERGMGWTLVHWPRLQTAEFFSWCEELTEPLRNM